VKRNRRVYLCDLWWQQILRDSTKHETKEKIGKLDDINIQNSCATKDIIKNVNRQPTKPQDNIRLHYLSHVSDEGILFRVKKP
jgi:hypothetical protein